MDLQFKQSRDIVNWLGDVENEEDINDKSSDEEDCVLESDHETDTEQEGDSDEDSVPLSQLAVYKGKDGTQWNKAVPPKNVRTRACNIVTRLPGCKGQVLKATSHVEIWSCLVNDDVIDVIVECTTGPKKNVVTLVRLIL